MHRVDTKKRRAVILRFTAYAVTLTLTVLTTVLLLYIALGYRIDGKNGHVTRSGLLLVDNSPEAGKIYINSELKDNATPGRFVLAAGSYKLALSRTDYRDWAKQVEVAASGVREVTYPTLIPKKLTAHQLVDLTAPELLSQSLDRKLLLTHVTNQAQFTVTELDAKNTKQTILSLPASVKRENNQFGTFKVIEWALNNKYVLLTQTLPSGATELVSLDVADSTKTVNVTSLYAANTPTDVHYIGDNTNEIYGIKDGTLSRYSLQAAEITPLLQNVRSYQPYSDDTILFDRTASQKNEIGIWHNKIVTVIQSSATADQPAVFKYANYDDHFYFVVGSPSGQKVTIYRDPLKKPILSKQLPLTTLSFAGPQKIDFSNSAQFVLVQNGQNFLTYDLEDLLQHTGTLSINLATDTVIKWSDSNHFAAQSTAGDNYLLEYDGQNQQMLVASKPGTPLFFANNYQHFFVLTSANEKTKLSSVSLVANKE